MNQLSSPDDDGEFDKYLIGPSKSLPLNQKNSPELSDSESEFDKYLVREPETSGQALKRNLIREGSRAAETFLGGQGEAEKFATDTGVKILKKVTGQEFPRLEKFLEKQRKVRGAFTPSEIKGKLKQTKVADIEPHSLGEKSVDDFVSDLTSIATQGGSGFLKNVGRAAVISGAGETGKQITRLLGGSESTQNKVKTGILLLTSFLLPEKSIDRYKNELYKDADSLLPSGAKVDATKLEKDLNSFIKRTSYGSSPEKDAGIREANKLLGKIKDGEIEVKEIAELKKDLNNVRNTTATGEILKPKVLKPIYSDLARVNKKAIQEYGKVNPRYVNALSKADEVHKTLIDSSYIKNFANKIYKDHNFKTAIGALFGSEYLLTRSPSLIGATAAGIGIGAGVAHGASLLKRIYQSPTLRSYYFKVLSSAAKEDARATLKAMKSLDDELAKEEKNK